MGQCCSCCPCCRDELRVASVPPKRLGAVFSDVDGTLLHYEAKLKQQGYERVVVSSSLDPDEEEERQLKERLAASLSPRAAASVRPAGGDDAAAAGAADITPARRKTAAEKEAEEEEREASSLRSTSPRRRGGRSAGLVRFRHVASGEEIDAIPVPPLQDGYISVKTLSLVERLREHDVDIVLMTGARTSTFLQRLSSMPLFDYAACEGGGRLYRKKIPPATKQGGRLLALSNAEEQLELDTEWLDRFVDAIGPWRYNQLTMDQRVADGTATAASDVPSRGMLWECYRALKDTKRMLDAGIDSVPQLDARSFTTAFLCSLVPHERFRRTVQNETTAERISVSTNPLSADAAATATSVVAAAPDQSQSHASLSVLGVLSTIGDIVAANAAAASANADQQQQQQQQRLHEDAVRLQLFVKEHFPLLAVHTNLSKAHIGPRDATKAAVVEYVCGKLGVDLGGRAVLASLRHEHKTVQREHDERRQRCSDNGSACDALGVEMESKRMRCAVLAGDIAELDRSIAEDESKIRAAVEKYRARLQEECGVAVAEAAARVAAERETWRGLRHFWAPEEGDGEQDDANADQNETGDEDLEPSELPLPLMETVECIKAIIRCDSAGENDAAAAAAEQEEDFWEEDLASSRYDNEDGDNAGGAAIDEEERQRRAAAREQRRAESARRHERSKWRGTLGCFAALVRATQLIDEIRDFSPFSIRRSRARQLILSLVDSGRVFVPEFVDDAERERQERLRMLKPSWEVEEEEEAARSGIHNKKQREPFTAKAIAPLVDWCRAVARFCALREELAPNFAKIAQRREEVRLRRQTLAAKRSERAPLQSRVDELAAEIASRRGGTKRFELAAAESALRLDALGEAISKMQTFVDAAEERTRQLQEMRRANGRKQAEQPRFCAALFDDENDLSFARLCDVGFAPSVAHPAVEDFLRANAEQRGAAATSDKRPSPARNEVGDDAAVYERCPVEGFLGTEYALQRLLDMVVAADAALVEWEKAQREAEGLARKQQEGCCV
jgi:hydroxymethylpyrimidine pyrophosphatase-like HAD family hydrolase